MTNTNLMTGETQLTLTAEERAYLTGSLQNAMGETRVEVHRTHSPEFRDRVLHEENLVRGLLEKLEKME
jgi:hypothetical protein